MVWNIKLLFQYHHILLWYVSSKQKRNKTTVNCDKSIHKYQFWTSFHICFMLFNTVHSFPDKTGFSFFFFFFFFHRWFCFHNGCIAEIMLKGHLKVNICQDLVWISVFSFLCIVFVSFLHVVAEHSWFSWFLTCFCFSPCYLFYIYARAMLVLLTSSWSCRPVCLFCHMQLV